MDQDYQSIVGKSMGEVTRDIADFLSRSCIMHGRQEMDLAQLLPELNMAEQFSFALLSEAQHQGWSQDMAERFYLLACGGTVGEELTASMIAAFRDPQSEAYTAYCEKYGSSFGLTSRAYWPSCLAVAIDAKAISQLMEYLRAFTFCLMEFAYMDDRNPDTTYAWSYYEAFQGILKELTEAPPADPIPPVVRALGGSAGKRENDSYLLSLGVDLQNPNPGHMIWNAQVDVTLKDRDGNVITVISDRVNCIDPGAVFHYGITRRIRGAAVSHIAATVRAERYLKLSAPVMKQIKLLRAGMKKQEDGTRQLTGLLASLCDRTIHSHVLHYQFLSAENKILGGGCEWFFEDFAPGAEKSFSSHCPVAIPNATKVVYSVDFNAQDLC